MAGGDADVCSELEKEGFESWIESGRVLIGDLGRAGVGGMLLDSRLDLGVAAVEPGGDGGGVAAEGEYCIASGVGAEGAVGGGEGGPALQEG